MRRLVAIFTVATAIASVGGAQAQGDAWIVQGRVVVPVEGGPIEGGAVRIKGSKIDAVGAALDPAGVPPRHVVRIEGGWVYPGLVDAGSHQGIRRERNDRIGAFQPGHRVVDACDPLHPGFAKNLAAGITTVHLVPGNAAVVGGWTAVVKVGPGGALRVLEADAGLKLSLVEREYPEGRAPTALIGAVSALQEATGDLAAALAALRTGGKPAFVAASSNREVQVAARLAADLKVDTVIISDISASRFGSELADGTSGVILDSLTLNRLPFEWKYLQDLAARNVPMAFATWAPLRNPSALRLNAAIAARRGLPAERVLRALTLDAAKILGVDASVGSLKAGKDADLIVLSAPIEDARAQLLLCVQDGKVVYRPGQETSHE